MSVHEDVDERVGQRSKVTISVDVMPKEDASDDSDADMVIQVEKCDLAVGSTESKDDGVEELPVLLSIVDPMNPVNEAPSGELRSG